MSPLTDSIALVVPKNGDLRTLFRPLVSSGLNTEHKAPSCEASCLSKPRQNARFGVFLLRFTARWL